jgi:hypothetical protein
VKLTRNVTRAKFIAPGSVHDEPDQIISTLIPVKQKFTVFIKFIGALRCYDVSTPLPEALWALRVFCHNDWKVVIMTERDELSLTRDWVNQYFRGKENRIEYCDLRDRNYFNVDLIIDDRSDYWIGRQFNWSEVVQRLFIRGLLNQGLLPKDEDSMMEILEDRNFSEYMEEVRGDLRNNAHENDIQDLERYAFETIEAVSSDSDRIYRALVGGHLLRTVLSLLTKQRFDPLGCLLLAQQEKKESS